MKQVVIPIFIPHKGCPFDCIYCNQKTISGQSEDVSLEMMRNMIEMHLTSVSKDTVVEIGFYGGSFTGIDKNQQIQYLETAYEYIRQGRIKAIRLSTRPDYISLEILEYLKEYGVNTIELGVQSLDQEVLDKTCRGHNREHVINASQLIKEFGINLGIQTMIGLPGDNREKDLCTAREVIGLKPALVRIYPTLVIKGTYLETMYYKGLYTPLTLETAVEICAELLEMYESSGIKVIRVGLQPTETINEGMDVAAGPFHSAFRQLVEARLNLHKLEELIQKHQLQNAEKITIFTGCRNISNVTGQKKGNINYLRDKYGYKQIKVKVDESLNGNIHISKHQ